MEALCSKYTRALGRFGRQAWRIDTVVLGCTHYSFAESQLRTLLGAEVTLLDSGMPVARQTRRRLEAQARLSSARQPDTQFFATGFHEGLKSAANNWLRLDIDVKSISI